MGRVARRDRVRQDESARDVITDRVVPLDDSHQLRARNVTDLQRAAGNRAVTAVLTGRPIPAGARASIQRENGGAPTTAERTKGAVVGDRHDIPHPYMNLGTWYKTLMTGRVADLYRTAGGFVGHAQQVQQELDRLIPLIDERSFRDPVSLATAQKYEGDIRRFIRTGAEQVRFDLPRFVFRFSGSSTMAIERRNGRVVP